jgi:hypothetical protein
MKAGLKQMSLIVRFIAIKAHDIMSLLNKFTDHCYLNQYLM